MKSEENYCQIDVFLFSKPSNELNLEDRELSEELIKEISDLGKELFVRLEETTKVLRSLKLRGWEGVGTLYYVSFTKDCSMEEAIKDIEYIKLNVSKIISLHVEELSIDGEFIRNYPNDQDGYPLNQAH